MTWSDVIVFDSHGLSSNKPFLLLTHVAHAFYSLLILNALRDMDALSVYVSSY